MHMNTVRELNLQYLVPMDIKYVNMKQELSQDLESGELILQTSAILKIPKDSPSSKTSHLCTTLVMLGLFKL